VKSESRDSLFMRVGGRGVETRVGNGVLHIRSQTRMLGYLNAPAPFEDGWYDTKDVVETKGDMIKVVGRTGDVINVGGLKFLPCEVEAAALGMPGVALVKAYGRRNPITGEHVELAAQPVAGADLSADALERYLRVRLPPHMIPQRIRIGEVAVGHRFKKA
jgi:acyl-CoA synthetase (AMP-forming)/AMP-acid ligase II